jgi:hypothetical protein
MGDVISLLSVMKCECTDGPKPIQGWGNLWLLLYIPGILVGCASVPGSNDFGSAILFVSHVSVVMECVSMWIWLFRHQRNGRRITSYRRSSPGVIDHFQLRSPVDHIANIIIIFPFDHPSSRHSSARGCIRTRIQQNSDRRLFRIEWETAPYRSGVECGFQSPEQSQLINSNKSGETWFSSRITFLIHF